MSNAQMSNSIAENLCSLTMPKCGGEPTPPFPGEQLPLARHDSRAAKCIGGCGGWDFTWHYEDEAVEELTCWGHGGDWDSFTSLKVKFTNGKESYIGTPKGNSVKFVFDPQETFHGDITISGNGHGTRTGYLAFTTGRSDGSLRRFECGNPGYDHWIFHPDPGLTLAGLFGKGGDDIDQLGLILREPLCPVESQQIIGVKCKGKTGPGGMCEAAFSEDPVGAHLTTTCDFCKTKSPGKCEGNFQYTRGREISTSSTSIDKFGGSTEFSTKFTTGFFFAKAEMEAKFSVNYEHTWEVSRSQADTEAIALGSACESSPKPYSKTNLEMTVVVGTMTGDLEFTVRTKRKCEDQPQITTHDGTVTIKNVPITSLTSDCTVVDVPCGATSEDPSMQEPTTDITSRATTTQTTSAAEMMAV